MEKQWYILQVMSGKEKMAVSNLEILKKSYEMEEETRELIGNIYIPEEEMFVIKSGKKKLVRQKILPGYVLIELAVLDNKLKEKKIYSDVVMVGGISTFVGMRNGVPVPVEKKELDYIFEKMGSIVKTKVNTSKIGMVLDFQLNEMLKVIDGPFKGLLGKVENIDFEKKKVRVKIEIFGMPTPVELDVLQVEKI